MDTVAPILVAAMFAFVVYRRVLRSVGRQRVSRGMFVRIAIFGAVGLSLLVWPSDSRIVRLAALAAGAAWGLFGLNRTRFEYEDTGTYYTPNPYIGLSVVALFVGRLIYRMATMPGRLQGLSQSGPPEPDSGFSVTLTLFMAIIGYYLCYYAGVLLRKQPAATLQAETGRD